MNTYAACVEDGVVTNVIVGTAEWANSNLGGVWVDCEKIGVGWLWDGVVFSPPVVESGSGLELGWLSFGTAVDSSAMGSAV